MTQSPDPANTPDEGPRHRAVAPDRDQTSGVDNFVEEGAPLEPQDVAEVNAPEEPDSSPSDLATELKERTADLQRLQAEYLNYKRRVDRDRELVKQNATYSVLSSLLPVLIPGILAYAKRDALIALVDGSPASGWLALLASAAVIALQIWMTRRATFRTCFDTLRGPMLEIGDCLWLCRFGVAMLLMVAATFLLVPQGEESLRTLFEHKRYFDVWYYLRACFFHGSVILFAFALWFSSGYLIDRFRPGDARQPGSSLAEPDPEFRFALVICREPGAKRLRVLEKDRLHAAPWSRLMLI